MNIRQTDHPHIRILFVDDYGIEYEQIDNNVLIIDIYSCLTNPALRKYNLITVVRSHSKRPKSVLPLVFTEHGALMHSMYPIKRNSKYIRVHINTLTSTF